MIEDLGHMADGPTGRYIKTLAGLTGNNKPIISKGKGEDRLLSWGNKRFVNPNALLPLETNGWRQTVGDQLCPTHLFLKRISGST